ncbi:MAG: hypothetical protein ABSE80_13565 [Halobacteriota archaeon]
MKVGCVSVCILACLVSSVFALAQVDGQQSPSSAPTAPAPRLIQIRGTVRDETGQPLTASTGITFTLYKDENDRAKVWQENQNVQLDSTSHHSVLLGQ